MDRRKCLIAEILKADGNIFGIIEVERQGKLLSTLILKEKFKNRLQWDYKELLKGLVRESGKWSNAVINNMTSQGIIIKRIKHVGESKHDNIKHIAMKIYQF
jgi:hypothetical protein